jgi:hypothetical protein
MCACSKVVQESARGSLLSGRAFADFPLGIKAETPPITPVRPFDNDASWALHGFARGCGLAAKAGEPMARNFGMPQQIRREYRGSLWPLLLIVFVLAGAIDIAAHLQHW